MEREFLQLGYWDQFTAAEAEAVGRTLARCLPSAWQLDRVEFHECGDQKRHVAFFTRDDARFALIPGGEITLGYDRRRCWQPSDELREDWDTHTHGRCGYPPLDAYLDQCMTPLRTVSLEPFLLEVEPREFGAFHDERGKHVRGMTRRQVCDVLVREGFRLPTSDEWEHACSAGSRTLWRWGEGDWPSSDGILRPNAFGLRIAYDTYADEPCSTPSVWRGGDGGSSACGGEGLLAERLALASAFHIVVAPRGLGGQPCDPEDEFMSSCHARRAWSLPPECLD
jgi:hypothetical protein